MIGKNRHRRLCPERLLNIRIGSPTFFECPITFTLSDGTHQYLSHLSRSELIRERSRWLSLVLLVESRLQELYHMFIASLLGIFLHARINGRVDLQSVCIYIIGGTIFLPVLITPSEQRVVLPPDAVNMVLHLTP